MTDELRHITITIDVPEQRILDVLKAVHERIVIGRVTSLTSDERLRWKFRGEDIYECQRVGLIYHFDGEWDLTESGYQMVVAMGWSE